MRRPNAAESFSLAVQLSAEIRRLEKTLDRLKSAPPCNRADIWHRQLLERSLASKRLRLEYLVHER